MDHHCPWLNNCVGVKTHIYFILLLNFLVLNIVSILALTLKNYIRFCMLKYGDEVSDDDWVFKTYEPFLGKGLIL